MKRSDGFRHVRILLPTLLLTILSGAMCCACGDSHKAAVMELLKTEGTVRVANEEGESVSVVDNMRIYSGYDLATAHRSYAWINLDSVKLTKMDAASEIEIQKSGNDLEIVVNAGKLYFNITEPLDENETLNIRTSNMAVGIRGTCGWVEAADERHMNVYILEGTVECSVTDPESGQSRTAAVSGGETAQLYLAGGETDISVEPFAEDAVDSFILEELKQDEELRDRIRENSGLDFSDLMKETGPDNSSEQAADELARQLGNAAREQASLKKKIDSALDGKTNEDALSGGKDGSLLSELQDVLLENMLDGTGRDLTSWWMQEFADVLGDGAAGEDGLLSVDYMQIRMGQNINCYKPNIYIYGEPGTSLQVSFAEPVLLTRTLPEYTEPWEVEIGEDGTLIVDGQAGYRFLFYESQTIPGIFQTEEGFFVKADGRSARFAEILGLYGFNEQETQDFIEFWDEMLDQDTDYLMYPQTTELVDSAMPIVISGAQTDQYFRLWFCFRKVDQEQARDLAQSLALPEIVPAEHVPQQGKAAIVEWGGMILP